jgi:SAM-dependent methyltransferase
MKALDRYLQNWRIARALPYIHDGDRLLDVGCFDRTLIDQVAGRVSLAVGLDPLAEDESDGVVQMVRGTLADTRGFPAESFDCITMLAVFEHLEDHRAACETCLRLLKPGGRVVLTVPRPEVDLILHVLTALRIIDGMSVEEHHGFDVRTVPNLFAEVGLPLHTRRAFQLGLNNLFVFEKPATIARPKPTPQRPVEMPAPLPAAVPTA